MAAGSYEPVTAGSLGLDLAAAVDVTLLNNHPVKIYTGLYGPIIVGEQPVGGLLLGRSSASMQGLFVLPGVIDSDYTGELMIMAYTLFPPFTITKGQRIAQIIPLPQLTKGIAPLDQQPRQDKGFGSTWGLVLLTLDLTSNTQ
uniref:dUTPase-like domain-containing protein n=1 Tax=Catharus ustulatus TaxID=91951 RepID=A0A8C3TVQ0_CATUS